MRRTYPERAQEARVESLYHSTKVTVAKMLSAVAEFEKAAREFDPQMLDAVDFTLGHRLDLYVAEDLGLAGDAIRWCLRNMEYGRHYSMENSYWGALPGEPPGFDIWGWAARGEYELVELLWLCVTHPAEAQVLSEGLTSETGYGSNPKSLGIVTKTGEVLRRLKELDPLFLAVGPGLASYRRLDRHGKSMAKGLDVGRFIRTIEVGLGVG